MSEEQIETLRKDIRRLSARTNRRHIENQEQSARRDAVFQGALATQQQAFAQAMSDQRQLFQEALNKQFLEHMKLEATVKGVDTRISLAIGDGQPGEGRLGVLEESMETMKKFRWQALTVVSILLLLIETLGKK